MDDAIEIRKKNTPTPAINMQATNQFAAAPPVDNLITHQIEIAKLYPTLRRNPKIDRCPSLPSELLLHSGVRQVSSNGHLAARFGVCTRHQAKIVGVMP